VLAHLTAHLPLHAITSPPCLSQLADAFGARMCVVTDGSRGSALALGRKGAHGAANATATGGSGGKVEAVKVPIYKGVTQKDATGA
jgi:hypothetical protein